MTTARRLKAAAIVGAARLLRWPLAQAGVPVVPASPRAVLVIKPCCLGDVLLATPAVAALRQAWPEARLDFMVGNHSRVMIDGNLRLDRIIDAGSVGSGRAYPATDFLQAVRRTRRGRYDIAVVLDRSPLTQLIPWLAAVPVRAGIDSGGRGFSLTHATPAQPVRHEAELYLDVVRALGVAGTADRMEFTPSGADVRRAQDLLAGLDVPGGDGPWAGKTIVIHPGGGENPGMSFVAKRWRPGGFAAVARDVLAGGGRVVFAGSLSERDLVAQIAATLPDRSRGRWIDLAGRTSLGELAAVIAQCDGFLGNDTGPMHLACAVATPTLSIFGPSNHLMYSAYGPRTATIQADVYCSPCLKDGLYSFAPDCVHQCMGLIEPATVSPRLLEITVSP